MRKTKGGGVGPESQQYWLRSDPELTAADAPAHAHLGPAAIKDLSIYRVERRLAASAIAADTLHANTPRIVRPNLGILLYMSNHPDYMPVFTEPVIPAVLELLPAPPLPEPGSPG